MPNDIRRMHILLRISITAHVQYASIKSLRSTIVKRSFYGASVCVSFQTQRCENGNGTEQSQERNGAKTVCKTVINYAQKLSKALDREIG